MYFAIRLLLVFPIGCGFCLTTNNIKLPNHFISTVTHIFQFLFPWGTLCGNASHNRIVRLLPFDDPQRIIGGTLAHIEEFPFAVSLQDGSTYRHFCGGSLINASKVLTACHCLVYSVYPSGFVLKHPRRVVVQAGTVDIYQFRTWGERLDASSLHVHPHCSNLDSGWIYDFGIIITYGDFTIKPHSLQPLPLSSLTIIDTRRLIQERTLCTTAGWGFTSEDGWVVHHLRKVDLFLLDDEKCHQLIKAAVQSSRDPELQDREYLEKLQLCTLGVDGKDACQGDSGGPLICNNILVATVSWGIGCGQPNVPGIWARVSAGLSWIHNENRGSALMKGCQFLAVGPILFSKLQLSFQ